jgi:hypothetical protein
MTAILLVVFILLHQANGNPVYIVPGQVVSVGRLIGAGGATENLVVTISGNIWVKESPEEVVKKLEGKDGDH